jgi:5'-deoxynucleotidase YfbR-like HD superfamily hydrolase
MRDVKKELEFLMETGDVERNHTHPGLLSDRVARHSWGVAMLAYMIGSARGHVTTHLLMAALTHDMGEVASSDVCGATKSLLSPAARREIEGIEAKARHMFDMDFSFTIRDSEKEALWMADKFEYLLRCIRERRMGNLGVYRGYREVCRDVTLFMETTVTNLVEREIFSAIISLWKSAAVGDPSDFSIFEELRDERRNNNRVPTGEAPEGSNVG